MIATGIETTVTTTNGTESTVSYTVNNAEFVASGTTLTIATNGAQTGTTLTDGNVLLATAGAHVKATTDESDVTITTLSSSNPGIVVEVVGGNVVQVDGLDTGDAFTVGDDTYTMTAVGLMKGTDLYNVDEGGSYAFNGTPTTLIQPDNGDIDVVTKASTDGTYTVVNDISAPAEKYAVLTVSDTGTTYTFSSATGVANITSITIGSTTATVTTDFAIGIVTAGENTGATYDVNGTKFVANGESLTISTDPSSETTLDMGLVILTATEGVNSVKSTNGKTVTFNSGAANGITVRVEDNVVSEIDDIDTGDSFTVNYTDDSGNSVMENYFKTAAGIFKTVDGTTTYLQNSDGTWSYVNLSIDNTWLNIIAAADGYVIDLSADDAQANAIIFNTTSDTKVGELNQSKRRYYH